LYRIARKWPPGKYFIAKWYKKVKPKRGRPRAYDPDTALAQATAAFWDAGYAATSLDDLSAATGMNRPSLYGAFGDKRALYRKALDQYRAMGEDAMTRALANDVPLAEALRRVYQAALSVYLSGERSARGCFMIGTAVTEAVSDPELRRALGDGFRSFDKAFEDRIRHAQQHGEVASTADPAILAKFASAVLYFLAIRSRAGESRAVLEATAGGAIEFICAAARPVAR
jgi:TetR/AcrR family transcriptional regulator, copper-responsive repressor